MAPPRRRVLESAHELMHGTQVRLKRQTLNLQPDRHRLDRSPCRVPANMQCLKLTGAGRLTATACSQFTQYVLSLRAAKPRRHGTAFLEDAICDCPLQRPIRAALSAVDLRFWNVYVEHHGICLYALYELCLLMQTRDKISKEVSLDISKWCRTRYTVTMAPDERC